MKSANSVILSAAKDLKRDSSAFGLRMTTIFLDLDNTLYAYAPCHLAGLKASYRFYRKSVEKISYRAFYGLYQKARETINRRLKGRAASHSRLLYFQTLLEKKFSKTKTGLSLRLEKNYWRAYFKKMKLKGWVLPFLKRMRREKKRIVIVTNLTSALQFSKIKKLRLEKWIDFVITSEEAGHDKPHPAIFRLACQKAGCSPSQVLVLGDDPASDRHPHFQSITLH
ncbi:MAG: HAD family hydrolase [Candidatus Omnitrophica bacterium]|nr:HAD family hydrolase [Candidatus Omnitrophota bacterium]